MSYIMIIQKTENTYSLTGAPKTKGTQKPKGERTEIRGKAEQLIVMAGDFSTHVQSPIDHASRNSDSAVLGHLSLT